MEWLAAGPRQRLYTGFPKASAGGRLFKFEAARRLFENQYFLEEGGYWRFVGAFRLGVALPIVAVGLLPEVRKKALAAVRDRKFLRPFIGLQMLVSWTFIVRFAAISTGPVSLVAGVSSMQPIFVFLLAFGLATMFPANFGDWITKRTIYTQVAGILAISAAVVIMSTQ